MSDIAQHNGNAAAELRRMTRRAAHAVMATTACDHKQVGDGWPVTSMVVPAAHIDGSPILLISDLADHTRHLQSDPRMSLLFTDGNIDPGQSERINSDNARLTIFGRTVADHTLETRQRYLQYHPDAAQYADFADFGFYHVTVEAVYWVGGFGKQRRLKGDQFIVEGCQSLITGHDDVIEHMNTDHADAIADIVEHFTGQNRNDSWKMVAIDCDGMDLECNSADSRPLRVDFTKTIRSPGDARDILVEMCKKARGQMT
ncbi:pyridoxamine 5'-phosphate oxidase [Thalassospira lucentensis]|uniref:Pyridoxamine 5'-phosphate oxidase n=1 Tax=Thalassospira lucentensis TaxID=168935 RepID=A0A154L4M4_9PROT|nr:MULTISPECIES: DUF2470 domain-containing protein [Thalassospira]KZB63519.1 pyridoxamine 5'-phosphate oxidase [Thalassospira lucentensis]MCH2273113.1 DUF2470 domain-containing protein [Thalassospira sp.]